MKEPKDTRESGPNNIALAIFEKFKNKSIHPTTVHDMIRVRNSFRNISLTDVHKAISLLHDLGLIDVDVRYGDVYYWTEKGKATSLLELERDLFLQPKELHIPLDFQLGNLPLEPIILNIRAYFLVFKLETELRDFIIQKLKEEIPESFKRKWEGQKKKEHEQFPYRKPLDSAPIRYSTFEDLSKIITKNENWQIFQKYFGKVEGISNKILELDAIRDTVMHSRFISQEDFSRLFDLVKDIKKCIT